MPTPSKPVLLNPHGVCRLWVPCDTRSRRDASGSRIRLRVALALNLRAALALGLHPTVVRLPDGSFIGPTRGQARTPAQRDLDGEQGAEQVLQALQIPPKRVAVRSARQLHRESGSSTKATLRTRGS